MNTLQCQTSFSSQGDEDKLSNIIITQQNQENKNDKQKDSIYYNYYPPIQTNIQSKTQNQQQDAIKLNYYGKVLQNPKKKNQKIIPSMKKKMFQLVDARQYFLMKQQKAQLQKQQFAVGNIANNSYQDALNKSSVLQQQIQMTERSANCSQIKEQFKQHNQQQTSNTSYNKLEGKILKSGKQMHQRVKSYESNLTQHTASQIIKMELIQNQNASQQTIKQVSNSNFNSLVKRLKKNRTNSSPKTKRMQQSNSNNNVNHSQNFVQNKEGYLQFVEPEKSGINPYHHIKSNSSNNANMQQAHLEQQIKYYQRVKSSLKSIKDLSLFKQNKTLLNNIQTQFFNRINQQKESITPQSQNTLQQPQPQLQPNQKKIVILYNYNDRSRQIQKLNSASQAQNPKFKQLTQRECVNLYMKLMNKNQNVIKLENQNISQTTNK